MGFKDFFQDMKVEIEGSKNIDIENKQMKKKTSFFKKTLKETKKELEETKNKYISLLEEKGEGFNQYIFWENKFNEEEIEVKEIKKEIADLKKDFKEYNGVIKRLMNKEKITSLAKCEEYDDLISYALGLYFDEKEIPLGITDVCKKLGITKRKIKEDSIYLAKMLDIDKWEIEE